MKSFEIDMETGNEEQVVPWTVNLKSFEIKGIKKKSYLTTLWTVNLKSFEIILVNPPHQNQFHMNCKLEKFWN